MNEYKTSASQEMPKRAIATSYQDSGALGLSAHQQSGACQGVPIKPVEAALSSLSAQIENLINRVDYLTDRLARVLDPEPPQKDGTKGVPESGNLAPTIQRAADSIGYLDSRIKSLLDRLQL